MLIGMSNASTSTWKRIHDDVDKKPKKTRFPEQHDYVYKKFGFSQVSWDIKSWCITPDKKIIYSPEFYVKGFHLTKWKIAVERKFDNDIRTDVVYFHLERLMCEQYLGVVKVDCILEYSDNIGDLIKVEIEKSFDLENAVTYSRLTAAGNITTENNNSAVFELKLEMLVFFPGLLETIAPCENIGIKKLSEDIGNVYNNRVLPDLKLSFENNLHRDVHKVILLNRITDEEFRENLMKPHTQVNLEDFTVTTAEKVIRFLYTGDLHFSVAASEPNIKVFKLAELLGVKEILDYYNPDEINFSSSIDVEEYHATWTIEDICNRNDFLLSPVMINKTMDMKWRIQIFPKGFKKKSKYADVFLKYEVTIPKYICVELFLKTGRRNYLSYRCLRKIEVDGSVYANFIKQDDIKNNFKGDDSLILSLRLRMSNGEENISVGGSKAGYKHVSDQKIYDRFSNDMLSIYQNSWRADLPLNLEELNIRILVHECILSTRCVNLSNSLKTNDLEDLSNRNPAVIFELFHFLYAGKLRRLSLEDIFSLCNIAVYYNFQNLALVIIEKLNELLSQSNETRIYDFALWFSHVQWLEGPLQNLLDTINLNNLYFYKK